jgi:hypothetical protein
VFFGHGACHILAGVYLSDPPLNGFYAERIVPGNGYSGAHVFVTDGQVAFDYHGYSLRQRLLLHHTQGWASCSGPGWNCRIEQVDFDLLEQKELNARKMLGPDQYHADPRLRAKAFMARINHAAARAKAIR